MQLNFDGNIHDVRTYCFNAVKPLSAMRFINRMLNLNIDFKKLKYDFVGENAKIDIEGLLKEAGIENLNKDLQDRVRSYVLEFVAKELNFSLVTRGHDFIRFIGIMCRDILNRLKAPLTHQEEIEQKIRLAFNDRHFVTMAVFNRIKNWEAENPPFKVLLGHISAT